MDDVNFFLELCVLHTSHQRATAIFFLRLSINKPEDFAVKRFENSKKKQKKEKKKTLLLLSCHLHFLLAFFLFLPSSAKPDAFLIFLINKTRFFKAGSLFFLRFVFFFLVR